MRLIDQRTDDGSRHFACLPRTADVAALRDHIAQLPDAKITRVACDWVAQPAIGFTYRSHRFSVSQRGEEIWLFVSNPQCPDVMLYQVASYCHERLLLSQKSR